MIRLSRKPAPIQLPPSRGFVCFRRAVPARLLSHRAVFSRLPAMLSRRLHPAASPGCLLRCEKKSSPDYPSPLLDCIRNKKTTLDPKIRTLFEKYFAGELSPEDEERMLRLMRSGKYDRELKAAIDTADWGPAEQRTLSEQQRERLDKVYHRLESTIRPAPVRRRLPVLMSRAAAVFAGILLLSAAAYFAFYYKPLQTVDSAYGEIRNLTLADGSVVTLNANSELRFRPGWEAGEDREVWLEGEAYFSVTHRENDERFIVHSDGIAVEVLGTEFNVNNRREDNQVVLRSGRIKIVRDRNEEESVIMEPGELFRLTEGREMKLEKVRPEQFVAWKNQRMVFDKTPLSRIAEMIEDNYGIPVRIENRALAGLTYTADIPSNKLEVLLEALSASYEMKIERNGHEIVFK